MSIRGAVEATLEGRDQRLLDRCDVDGIVTAIELYGCYDCDELFDALESSFGAVQTQLGNTAPPAQGFPMVLPQMFQEGQSGLG